MADLPSTAPGPRAGDAGGVPSRIDRASLVVDASAQAVYEALLDPRALESWLPPDGAVGEIGGMDAREGGGFMMALRFADPVDTKTTADSDVTHVRFVQLRPGEVVAQQVTFDSADPRFHGAMHLTWQLEPAGHRTRVTVTATEVPPGITQRDHEVGLASSLAHLARYLSD